MAVKPQVMRDVCAVLAPIAQTQKPLVVSIAAGADIALVSMATSVLGAHSGLVGAITSGSIPAEQIDRSVGRVLTAKGVTGDCP